MGISEKETNALKYMPENWTKLWPPTHQRNTINETLNIIEREILKNGVSVNFRGQTLHFDCLSVDDLKIDWKFSDVGECSGLFSRDNNCIEFDNKLKKDGLKLYETLYHEYTHKLQSALINHMDLYPNNSAEYEYLSMIRSEVAHKKIDGQAFGKSFFGDSYLDPARTLQVLQKTVDFVEAAYNLQLSERSARMTGYNAYEYILSLCKDQSYAQKHKIKNTNPLEEAFEVVRRECGCLYLTKYEICRAFDEAKLNITSQRPPTKNNDLEAMITYKLATLLRAQNDQSKDKYKIIDEYISDSTRSAMKHAMLTYYEQEGLMFVPLNSNQRIGDYVFVNDLFEINSCNLQALQEMSEGEQIRNPHIIAYAIMLEGAEAINQVRNVDAFQLWYYSNLNDLSPGIQESLAEKLGEEYSPEYRKSMNVVLNEVFEKEEAALNNKCQETQCYDEYLFNTAQYDEQNNIIDLSGRDL